jgi:uncharacterized damage-inducible protein DinB
MNGKMGVYMPAIGQAFIDQSRTYLSSGYLPRIRRCVQAIADEDLWWRPNPRSNSIGNLILHLAGNVRQWIVSGIGGESDTRERQEEFDADRERSREELVEILESTLGDVDRVLAQLRPEDLLERRVIQGREVSVLEALYHVVEHFGMHTGQIIYITKLRTGTDLQFYEVEGGIARPMW